MRRIKLTQNKVALVDTQDYAHLMQWKWCAIKVRNSYYAARKANKKNILMHRVVAKRANKLAAKIDHVNQNGLDNRRRNLRPITTSKNGINARIYSTNTSGVTGVYEVYKGKWTAHIGVNGRLLYLGTFTEKKDAIAARKQAEQHYFPGIISREGP